MSSIKIRFKPTLAALLGCSALAGCLPASGPLSPDFGVALAQNLAAQVADPDAVYERTLEPASNGQRAADAADRYVRGRVTPPVSQTASRVGGSGAGSAGASSGGQ